MSLTGNDVLALIERTLNDTRGEVTSIDARLMRFTVELERLKQAEIGCLSVLAKMRLREIEGASVVGVSSMRRARASARCWRSARPRTPTTKRRSRGPRQRRTELDARACGAA